MATELIQFIDLTSLELSDNEETAKRLVEKSNQVKKQTGQSIASICVYPQVVKAVKEYLGKNPICSIASVAGGFPTGEISLDKKLEEVQFAINEGAGEIDLVFSRQMVFENKMEEILLELTSVKKACGNKLLKVILETGELTSAEAIEQASACAIMSGADFIKTSTGKIPVGATKEAVEVMLRVIKTHYQKTGNKVGIKISGGISKIEIAVDYMKQVEKDLGGEWMHPNLFRIGASRLLDEILLSV